MIRRSNKKGVNWNVERRYEFIEFRLYWQGNINRNDLMEAFGISVQQASKDLTNYLEGRKSNLTYDKRLRPYLRGKNFKLRYFQPDAAEYFAQLQAVEQGLVAEEQSWISFFLGYAATPIPARGVDPEVLREALSAIREKSAIKIIYQSMSRPDLHMGGDLKATGAGNPFEVFGEPDIKIEDADDGMIRVTVFGVDGFKPQTGEVLSEGTDGIALWMLYTVYNEESFFVSHAYFLGANDPYKALKAEIDEDTWDSLYSDTPRPFPKPKSGRIAAKVINHLGDEVMKIFGVG